MKAGQIVIVDWRDAIAGFGEPNKLRPAVVVGSRRIFAEAFPFEIVVPLTSEAALAIFNAAVRIEPTKANECARTCYALSWNVQCVPHQRLRATAARVSDEQLATIRRQICACVYDET